MPDLKNSPRKLTKRQSSIVSREIRKESQLRKQAFRKRFAGKRLTSIEQTRIKRPRQQIIRIGFEKARKIDPSIPIFMMRRVR